MSLGSAKAFLSKLETDNELLSSMRQAEARGEVRDRIVRAGYSFTRSELNQAWESVSMELSDADLELVSGGCIDADEEPK